MATHSSTLAWRIPWMEKPGGLPSMGSHRVGHDWRDLAAAAVVATTKSPQSTGLNHLQVHFRHRFKSGLGAQRAIAHKLYNNVTLPSSTRISIFGCKEAPSHLPSKHQKMVKLKERANYSLYNLLKLSTSYFVSKWVRYTSKQLLSSGCDTP